MTWQLLFEMILTILLYVGSFMGIIAIFWLLKEFFTTTWIDQLEDEEIIFHEDGWDGVKKKGE